MDSPSRQQLPNATARSAPTTSLVVPPPPPSPFHGSRYFKVLGRIDEESSFRASLSNMTSQDSSHMTSQDSSPRSSSSFEDSEGPDWLSHLSPERSITFIDTKKQGLHLGLSENYNRNTGETHSNQNVSLLTTVTDIEDRNMDSTPFPSENREDRSSPAPIKSQSPPLHSPSSHETLDPLPQHESQQRQKQQLQLQQQLEQKQKQQIRKADEKKIRQENEGLRKQCEELEQIILQMKTEGNILQMQTMMKLQSYQAEIDRETQQKKRLQTQCHDLEDRIYSLHSETRSLQENIWAIEENLRQKKR